MKLVHEKLALIFAKNIFREDIATETINVKPLSKENYYMKSIVNNSLG